MNKEPIVLFTIASKEHFSYAVSMLRSFRKFHDWPVIIYTNEKDPQKLKQLPKNINIEDLTPYLKDPMFFYRATPILAEPLLDKYECALKMDADQLILGDLDYIKNTADYDCGVVINWNRADPQVYGFVELARIGIAPVEYFNCGLVALRNKKFVHNWKVICYSPQFDRVQYKEQDILNVLCYYGNYNVRCFDHGDGVAKYTAWHGIISKNELVRAIIRDKDIIVPKGEGTTPFPNEDTILKVVHKGGGGFEKKDNWNAYFTPEVMKQVNELIK